jgi:hypothetical protein
VTDEQDARTPEEIIAQSTAGVSERFGRELEACDAWLAFVLDEVKPWPGRALNEQEAADNILVALFARSINTYWSALQLARIGFGDQAVMLTRSLFEDMVDAHWVSVQPAQALERFAQHFEHAKMLFADAARNHPEAYDPDSIPSFDPSDRRKLDKIFGRYGDKSWTGVPLHDRVAAIEHLWTNEEARRTLHFVRRIVYRDSNQQLHPSAQGLRAMIRWSDQELLAMRVGPDASSIEKALWSAFWNSVQIMGLIIDHFEFPGSSRERKEEQIRGLKQAFFRPEGEVTKTTGRNDRCPCGSGLKFKKCHGA